VSAAAAPYDRIASVVEHAPRVQRGALVTQRHLTAAVALLGVWLFSQTSLAPGRPAAAQPDAPTVVLAEYDGIIHPITAEFIDEILLRADRTGAIAVILVLRTPGGLLESTRTIISRMVAYRAPIVVFIAPPGERAASAGFLITLAADVAVMAPGTHIGAAHPVPSGGEAQGGEVMSQKMAADAAAYARTIAETRKRNAVLAAEAVTESRAFTDSEALHASPPLIDFVARDIDDLLRQLDGRRVTRFDGQSVVLHTAGARLERVEMTWRQSMLGAIAHPQIAYLLLTIGMLGLVVEMWNPGMVLPGVAGGICLLLAFFAFQVLPINVTGLLLIVFGIALLGAELMVPSFGVLGIGGTLALLAGSLMITRDVPGIRVGYGVIVPVVVGIVIIFLGLGRLALQAQRQQSTMGTEALIGADGQSLTALAAALPGQVSVHGEIWQAVSDTPIPAGQRLRVRGAAGLTLHVEPVAPPDPPGDAT
jgi:membrane-bound serine protease (ClpP class)